MSYDESKVEAIYQQASQMESADQRMDFLKEACGDDDELLQRVKQLLDAGDELGSFLEQDAASAVGVTVDDPVTERPGSQVGRYKLLEEIGEGGFGLVFVAQQHEPIDRRVALKVVKPGMDTREVIARFEAERQALALMDHPNIAKVFDAGTTESGRPYFVMELVRGLPITNYCDQAHFTLRQRLDLFTELGKAIQHAHQKGIIHRDIKPTNVLVTEFDGRPTVKIIDFGVAKALDRQLSQHSVYTRFFQMIGTPMYMSPEQTGMSSLDVDTRSDIYSLGVLLYELLTGSTPFDRQRLAHGALQEVQRIIREEEPHKPSTKLSESGDRLPSIAAARHTEPARLEKLIRGDLDWIVMKCLEKDRNRRYDTALGLVHDVERYLHHEPVTASPPSVMYRLSKFARKYRAALTVALILVLMLILGSGIATWQAIRATKAERVAEASAQRTERVLDFLISAFRKPDPFVEGREVKVADVLEQAMEDIETKLADDPLQKAAVLNAIGTTLHALGIYNKSQEAHKAALDIRDAELGNDHLDTLRSMGRLAMAYHSDGQLEKAQPLLERTLQLSRIKLGELHTSTVVSMINLAMNYKVAGQIKKALPLYEKSLELTREGLGEDHPDTIRLMSNLGEAYRFDSQLDKAIPLLEKTLELSRSELGQDSLDTNLVTHQLASAYYTAGKIEKASRLFERVLEFLRVKLGVDHPMTLATEINAAACFQAVKQFSKAITLYERILNLGQTRWGVDHPMRLTSMGNLGHCYQLAGDLERALPLQTQALQLTRAKLGDGHPNTLTNMKNLAKGYQLAGDANNASRLCERAVELARVKLGDDHSDTLGLMHYLADFLHIDGDLEKALPLYEETFELRVAQLGDTHGYTLATMRGLAAVYMELGRQKKAAGMLADNIAHERARLPENSPYLASVLREVACVLLRVERFAEAETHLRECLAINLKQEPASFLPLIRDQWLFQTKSLLGEALAGQERFGEAEPLLLEGFEGMRASAESIPRPFPLDMKDAAHRLISFYTQTNQPEAAAKWQAELESIEAEIKRLQILIDVSDDVTAETPETPTAGETTVSTRPSP